MKTKRSLSRFFWTTDAGLTGILIFLVLFLITIYSLADYHFGEFLAVVFFSLFFISGAIAIFDWTVGRMVAGGLILAAVVFAWVDFLFPYLSVDLCRILSVLVAMGFLIVALLTQIFQAGAITYHRICGALAVFLLLGWIWADLYFLIVYLQPDAIQLPQPVTPDNFWQVEGQLFYFSFVTLTTLGYGDIVPVAPSARLLVMLEALVGQLYPAITLAWLVAMEIVSRGQKK